MLHRRFVFALVLGLAAPGICLAQGKDTPFTRTNPKFLSAFREVVAKPRESTVRILCDGKDTALGMIVQEDGWVLTKFNDLKGKISVRLTDGKVFDAKLTGVHKAHDLAMLKIEATGLKAVSFHESKGASAGEWIACVGPGEDPVAFGVVSVGTRDMPKSPIIKGDLSKSGYLGVALEPGKGGVKVIQVLPDSAAAKAGLKVEDVILSLQGKNYLEPEDFIQAMARFKPDESITLKVRRGEEELEFTPKLGKRPGGGSRADIQNKMGSELSSRRTGYPTILQHDSVVKPVDCGGPLVDLEGRVIGINICRAGRVESWAVPAEIIKTHMKDLMTGKLAPPKEEPAEEKKGEEKKEEKKDKKGRKKDSPTFSESAFVTWPSRLDPVLVSRPAFASRL